MWDEHSLQECFFFLIILEGALSHVLDLDQHRDLVAPLVPSALVTGSLALERGGWAMPEPHLSAGERLYQLSQASS